MTLTFTEWWQTNTFPAGQFDVAKAAWDAAIERAAKVVSDTAKRYTCKKRIALCHTIADQIRKGSQ